jgi:hypothetical protein
MTTNQTLNTRYRYAPTDERRAALRTAVQALKENAMPDLVDLPPGARRFYVKSGPKSIGFKKATLAQAQATLDIVPKGVDMSRFAEDVASADELREILQALQHVEYALEGSIMVLDKQGYDDAAACFKGAEIGARLGQPAAERMHVSLKAHVKRGKPAKPAVPAGDAEHGAPEAAEEFEPPALEE